MQLSVLLSLVACAVAIKNPVIPGWNPDASILRVGSDYYIATSSFEYYPGTPIYKSKDLANWELFSHVQTSSTQVQLYGIPTSAGVWAPTLSYHNGTFYAASMTRWVYDPVARVWPRVLFYSSKDLIHWSEPVWCEPWGIDPALFHDPVSGKTYLNLMAPNNNIDRLWGIYGCEVSLATGDCVGPYASLWNGTIPQNSSTRAEGPKMFYKDEYYYLLIAEGGTDELHRATIARSKSPQGPFEAAPGNINPLMYNGAYGAKNLTVQSTGHATFVETENGEWYASFIARRNVNGSSPLGREGFLTMVDWKDGWPIINKGRPIMLSQEFGSSSSKNEIPEAFIDDFSHGKLDAGWYQLRTPYTKNYHLGGRKGNNNNKHTSGLYLKPNVYSLSERDTPAALLRKQKSLNMTFSAALMATNKGLNMRQTIGISAYLSEFQHADVGVTGCVNATGVCIYTSLYINKTTTTTQIPLNQSTIPNDLTLQIRAEPLQYSLGYTVGQNATQWVEEIASKWLAFAPKDFFVFSGASWAVFASGGGEPWGFDSPAVGFQKVKEEYFEENIPDYDVWN